MSTKRLYFGHPVNVYGTELEKKLLVEIARIFPEWEVVNPGDPVHEPRYQQLRAQGRGMSYYFDEVLPLCDGGVFLAFSDGAWGRGVFSEAEFLVANTKRVWQIQPSGHIHVLNIRLSHRVLDVESTRARVRLPSGALRPYEL
ncbi:MAG: hypothetical protein AAB692_06230 [Patescibacteria group bacterium]|mgnify:CR=1 FL=1